VSSLRLVLCAHVDSLLVFYPRRWGISEALRVNLGDGITVVVLLEPLNPEAWVEHARIAEAQGNLEAANQSRARAAALSELPSAWASSTPSAEC
jgi:hypothetical protein